MTIAGQLNPPDEEVEKDDPQQQAVSLDYIDRK